MVIFVLTMTPCKPSILRGNDHKCRYLESNEMFLTTKCLILVCFQNSKVLYAQGISKEQLACVIDLYGSDITKPDYFKDQIRSCYFIIKCPGISRNASHKS